MDIEEILELVPRTPEQWTIEDVECWLLFVQLPQLTAPFREHGIDGPRLLRLTWSQLKCVPVPSNIIKKKILNWASFLRNHQAFCHHYLTNPHIDITTASKKGTYVENNSRWFKDDFDGSLSSAKSTITKEMIPKMSYCNRCPSNHEELHIYQRFSNESNKFVICDKPQLVFGRSSRNSFILIDRDIEPNHCSIIHCDEKHYLSAPMTSSGLWVFVSGRLTLPQMCVLEMGETDFSVRTRGRDLIITFTRLGDAETCSFDGLFCQQVRVGRKNSCDIVIPFDTTLSGYHGKFTYDERWFFEDFETTNGSWTRVIEKRLITDRMLIRIGRSTFIYECRLLASDDTRSINSVQSELELCRSCRANEKNCYFRPCYHNQFCYQCGKGMKRCGVCSAQVKEVERIFKP